MVAIVPASDLEASRAFYERLGFAATAVYPQEGYYILHDRGDATLHLTRVEAASLDPKRNVHGLYFYSEEVDELAERFATRAEPKPWGMREFAIADPDGTLVRVGCPMSE